MLWKLLLLDTLFSTGLIFLWTFWNPKWFLCLAMFIYKQGVYKVIRIDWGVSLFSIFRFVNASRLNIQLCFNKSRHALCLFLCSSYCHPVLGMTLGNSLTAVWSIKTTLKRLNIMKRTLIITLMCNKNLVATSFVIFEIL